MTTGLLFLADLWEAVPLFIRAVYICWIIYAVFYWVIRRYEKEHDLVKTRQLANLNKAYSFYALLILTIVVDRFVVPRTPGFHFTNDPALYESLATLGYVLMSIGLLIVISARITLNGFWGGGIFIYDPSFKEFVQSGLYRIVRHPVYFGQLLLALGMVFIMNIWALWFFPLGAAAFNVFRARAEEADLHKRIGDAYEKYRDKTHFMFPGIW